MTSTVFYSFHYEHDVHRVQLVRNIAALQGQPLLNSQEWEKVRGRGDGAIQGWIDEQMSYKRAVVVLVGRDTATRPWVIYEIQKAWRERRALLGVRIHGLSSMGEVDREGGNPFAAAQLDPLRIPLFDPTVYTPAGRIDSQATYAGLASRLVGWAGQGVTAP